MRNLPQLTGLRAVAALAVLAYHAFIFYEGNAPHDPDVLSSFTAHYGFLGVDLFFVLSGFLLARGLIRSRARLDVGGWREFLYRRWLRTAPPYYASILFALALGGAIHYVGEQPWRLLAHLAYLHTSDASTAASINIVFWTLAVEFQMYAILPLLVWLVWRRPALAVASTALVSVAWPWLLVREGALQHNFWVVTQAPAYFFHFGLGILVARAEAKDQRLSTPARLAVPAALLGMLLVEYAAIPPMGLWDVMSDRWTLTLWRVVPAAAFAVLIHIAATQEGWGVRLLSSAPAQHVGTISYSLYLTHLPVLGLLHARAPWTMQWGYGVYLLAILPVCWLAAVLLYHTVEAPALEWKARRSTKAPQPLPSPAPAGPVPGV